MEDDDTKLSASDYASLAVEAGIGMIPTIGGALQTAYFGAQNEKRFKRIEQFYKELSEDVDKLSPLIEPLDENKDHDQVIGIFETINEEIEKARSAKKREYFKNLYLDCLKNINKDSWDQEEFFSEVLVALSVTELQILNKMYLQPGGVGDIYFPDVPNDVLIGGTNRLFDFALVKRNMMNLTIGAPQDASQYQYRITPIGDAFIRSCVLRP